jgi:hypothetical protein
MHTQVTLLALSAITVLFGRQMRRFKSQTCDHVETFELDREVGARARRLARENPASPTPAGGKKPKAFNLFTYKFHALGDYVSSIRLFGTTDSYSTQIVSTKLCCLSIVDLLIQSELEHRTSKANYPRTSKNNAAKQLAAIERRQVNLHKIVHANQEASSGSSRPTPKLDPIESEPISNTSPHEHHHIAASQRNPVRIGSWLTEHARDPALQVGFCILYSYIYLKRARTFCRIYRIIFWLVSSESHTMVTNISSLMRIEPLSSSRTTRCILTRYCASTTRHTIFVAVKIQLIHSPYAALSC